MNNIYCNSCGLPIEQCKCNERSEGATKITEITQIEQNIDAELKQLEALKG